MPKQSRLGDDAYIYQPHKQQTEKEKLSEMSFKGKLDYLYEYYKFHALAVIAAIALVSYFIYTALHPVASPQFSAAMINNTVDDRIVEQLATDFSNRLQLDPKRETVDLNTTYNFGVDDQYMSQMKQVLITKIQAHQVDVIIAPESLFYDYAHAGILDKLSDQLPTDIYSSLADQFYLTDTEDDAQKNAYGIYLTNTKLYRDYADNSDPYVLGIVINSPDEANTIEFIRYLFNEGQ